VTAASARLTLLRAARHDVDAPGVLRQIEALAAKLATDANAIRSALRGPDPQFALRVVADVAEEMARATVALAKEGAEEGPPGCYRKR
jgi:hypothetical protein